MALANRVQIELHRDDPLAAAERYRKPLATVHGALAFHYDNEAAINKAIGKARDLGEQLGACSMPFAIEEMNEGLNAPCRQARTPHYAESK